jgi:[ribosomal protein S18]-alanine N-acetyltransferase
VNAILRSYRPEDFETLHAIDQACYPRGIAYSKRGLRWFLALPGADCIVAETQSQIAGFILCEAEGPRAHIITIDVLEGFRRAGVGSALVREAEQRLVKRGVRAVELETAQDNQPAIAFWQKHGYRTRRVYKRYYLGRVDALAMVKLLAAPKET